jgi:predicted nuclease of restriction endonuclease-like (RecB) superfamily
MSSESQPTLLLPADYADWLSQLKRDITQSQQRATLSANAELVQLYGRIGRDILQRQSTQGWGAKVIDRLAHDLKDAFPDMRGFSSRNLKYMAFFAQLCPDGQIGQQPGAQLPWFHIVTLLTQLDGAADRDWYAAQTVQQRWSRSTLELNIKNRLHLRQGGALSNFEARLPSVLRSCRRNARTLLAIRSSWPQIKAQDDKPTIGLLLCKQQNRLVAEYALSGIDKPIGIAEYQLLRDLPESLGGSLPSIAEIEAELASDVNDLDEKNKENNVKDNHVL